MRVTLDCVHVEYGPESWWQLGYDLYQILVSDILDLTCDLCLHTSDHFQVVAHFQGILSSEFHQGSRDKDLSGPAFKGTISLVVAQMRE